MIKRRLAIYLGGALAVVSLFLVLIQPTGALPRGGTTSSSSTSSSSTSSSSTSSSSTSSSTTSTTTPPGEEGCTPGFWKIHLGAWAVTGFSPDQTLDTVFDAASLDDLADATLLEALSFGGGSTLTEAKQILLRQAVASLLNSAHPDVDFSLTTAQVISAVNTALATDDRDTILDLAEDLAAANEAGCPL
jgi:hypothetical protein